MAASRVTWPVSARFIEVWCVRVHRLADMSVKGQQNVSSLQSEPKRGIRIFAGHAWLAILLASLSLASYDSFQSLKQLEEYAYGCDAFGYLQMARDIRTGFRTSHVPTFGMESEQIHLLVDAFQEKKVPVGEWRLLVGPQAYLYFPKSGQVGVQYPPGTGLALALFSEGKAVLRLNKAIILLFFGSTICAAVIAAIRRRWLGAGFVALALYLGLRMLVENGTFSFSINAIVPVLWLTLAFLFWGLWLRSHVDSQFIAWLVMFLAGLLFGFSIMIRLPAALLAPGLLVLLWPTSFRPLSRNQLLPFGLGVLLGGILPVLAYQSRNTGAWYVSSYAPEVNSRPTLTVLHNNLVFYFWNGRGAVHNWAFLLSAIGLAGFMMHHGGTDGLHLSWRRIVASAAVLWAVPAVYFATHEVTTPYYLVPSTFATVALIGIAAFTLESSGHSPLGSVAKRRIPAHRFMLGLALLPGIAVAIGSWKPLIKPNPARWYPHHSHFLLPRELSDPHAWVWADFESGTLWYYAHKPAFKVRYASGYVRAMVYKFVEDRQERQYIVQDSPYMQAIMEEVTRLGGVLERRPGTVGGSPYFLIHWARMDARTAGPAAPDG